MHRPFGARTPSSFLALVALVALVGLAGAAQADERDWDAGPRLALVLVEASAEARMPAEDIARVRAEIQAQLEAATERVDGCIAEHAPREEPPRDRERRMVVEMRLGPSGGATRVWVARDSGMPPVVRRCALEEVRAVEVSAPPPDEVQLRVVFDLR